MGSPGDSGRRDQPPGVDGPWSHWELTSGQSLIPLFQGRTLLEALSEPNCLQKKKPKALNTTLKICCHLAPCYPLQPHCLVVPHAGTSLSCFRIMLSCPSAERPSPHPLLTAILLGLPDPDQHHCLCLSRCFP